MDATLQRRTLDAFEAALDRPDEDRERWAIEQFSAEPELLIALRRLLETDRRHAQALPTALPQARRLAPVLTPPTVGVWRLGECLGRGGMGQVYLGERDDGLFEQKVAIKLMAPGLFPAAAALLFDNERRVLARLRHPHIAQIYDGGVTPQGQPFFAMELVEGEPIDGYCAERDLPVREVLRLFLDACSAIRHAHQNLVVHADLKPSNIHVDRAGQVKLLDFGIARLVAQNAEQTQDLPQPLTPAYASPGRQAGEPATPTDDVYSLGVVLFELLAGVRPDSSPTYGQAALMASQVVLAGDGPLPRRRQRARLLRGDLDAIAARAIAPLAQDRYPSVDALVGDLERWQRKLPVSARAGGWRYRAERFLVRNRLGVTIGVAAISGLSVALAVTTQLYLRAEAARAVAEQHFDDVRAMSKYMLFDLDAGLETVPGTTPARRQLVEQGQRYLDTLAETAGDHPELQREVAAGLTRLAEIQGGWSMPNVGETDQARRNFERAESMLADLVQQRPGEWSSLRELGHTQVRLADFYGGHDNDAHRQLAKAREAETHALRAIETAVRQGVTPGAQAKLDTLLSNARLAQVFALNWTNQPQAAADIAEREEARLLGLPEAMRREMNLEYQVGRTVMFLGDALYYLGEFEDALATYRRALERYARGLAEAPRQRRLLDGAATGYWSTSATLIELGRLEEALNEIDHALPLGAQLLALDPENVNAQRTFSMLRSNRLQTLGELRRYEEAIALAEDEQRTRATRAARSPDDAEPARDAAILLYPLADYYWKHGNAAAACATSQRAAQAWAVIEKRWGMAELDRKRTVEFVEAAKRCPESPVQAAGS